MPNSTPNPEMSDTTNADSSTGVCPINPLFPHLRRKYQNPRSQTFIASHFVISRLPIL